MTAPASRPRGPRGAEADTRGDILAAALELFATEGYAATSMRAVARRAGVDPALVRHYFHAKSELFVASMGPLDRVAGAVDYIQQGPRDQVGRRVAEVFISVWGSPDLQPRLRAIIAAAVASEEIADVAKRMILERLFAHIAEHISPDRPHERAGLAASHVLGLAMSRYVLRMHPLTDMTDEDLVAYVAPALQRYLVDELP